MKLFSRQAHIAAEQRNSQRRSRAQPEQGSLVLSPLPSASHAHSSSRLPPPPTAFSPLPTPFCSPEPLALKALASSHVIALGLGRRGTGEEDRGRLNQQRRKSVKKRATRKNGALKPMAYGGRLNEWELFNLQTFSDRMKGQVH